MISKWEKINWCTIMFQQMGVEHKQWTSIQKQIIFNIITHWPKDICNLKHILKVLLDKWFPSKLKLITYQTCSWLSNFLLSKVESREYFVKIIFHLIQPTSPLCSTFINTRIQHIMPMYCDLILLDLKPLIKGVGMHKPLHNSHTTIQWKLSWSPTFLDE
jgi:hypothetical protein